MRTWLGAVITALVLILASPVAPAAAAQGRTGDLDTYVEALVRNQNFNGGVLVIDGGQTVFERAFGVANLSTQEPNTPTIRFAYASISKLFTATAIFQLAEAGKLDLDAPAARYLPGFPYPRITIRNLLNHSSGLSPFSKIFGPLRGASPARVFTNSDFLEGLAANPPPLLYEPGSESNYDNINFTVLALVIESVSGERYPDYISRHVLGPAGMDETRFVPIGRQVKEAGSATGIALPYHFPTRFAEEPVLGASIPAVINYWTTYAFTGFGDYVGTMQDLARFAAAYDRLVGPELRASAVSINQMSDGRANPNNIGLSWSVGEDAVAGPLVYHAGSAFGLSTALVRSVERDQTVIVFSNMEADARGIAFEITRMINGQDVDLPRRSLAREYVRRLLREGPEAASGWLDRHRGDPGYRYDEKEMNAMGYNLLAAADSYELPIVPNLPAALEVFRTNLADHPQSWNAYDSYGEALAKAGRRDEAIAMYERSLELHDRPAGRQALEALRAGQ